MFLPFEADLQGFAVIALASAHIAGHVHVGEEVHLHFDHAVALAGLAAAALDVEAEAPGFVAACARLRYRGEDLANGREQAGIGGRIGARRAADRALIDLDHPIDVFQTFDAVEMRRAGRGAVELRRHRAKQACR